MTHSLSQHSHPLKPLVMGIVNVTPDSFSDGGAHAAPNAALDHALRLADEGADILDVGGESTRPGALAVAESEEWARVIPLVEALAKRGLKVSVDTQKAVIMHAAIGAGAWMINDVNALQAPGALAACAANREVRVCLMHRQGEPNTMQHAPRYRDVVAEVGQFLLTRTAAAEAAGIAPERITLDPGFGFGKTLAHNLALFRALPAFAALGYPVLVGLSRKSMLGAITGRTVDDRLVASVVAAMKAAEAGAAILRVHDVRATVDALSILRALGSFGPSWIEP